MQKKIVVSWSGGKDSALSLYEILKNKDVKPVSLLTVFTEEYDRVSMHGIRHSLIERQALSIGIPLHSVYIPKNCPNKVYEEIMEKVISRYVSNNVAGFVFGDIFLEDVRRYREERLLKSGVEGYFPLWGRDTRKLVIEFIRLGFKAITTCVDGDVLDKSYVCRDLNEDFLNDLPPNVDWAGENGEYHTFVWDGPIFKEHIHVEKGEIVNRGRFYYCDLLALDK